jgi:hypothetical protein
MRDRILRDALSIGLATGGRLEILVVAIAAAATAGLLHFAGF